ncbi:MAG: response regulator, partial [Candidatus Binatia bacterium]
MPKPTPKILAVDDNKQNLELLIRALGTAKYEVITAADGPTALQLIDSGAPDLVLLDVMMPGMSGYEVCE